MAKVSHMQNGLQVIWEKEEVGDALFRRLVSSLKANFVADW